MLEHPRVQMAFGLITLLAAAFPVMAQPHQETPNALIFQTDRPWSPRTNIGSDMVLAYGIDATLADRIRSWKNHGYHTAVMTGVAWGRYAPYLRGDFDGKQHWDETQEGQGGKLFLHDGRDVPYIAPSEAYGKYLSAGVLKALDAGAEAVYLEEPEFWAEAGWSKSFQRSWSEYYHQPWQAPDSSPDAQYRASQLKYVLYRRALQQVFDAVRQYAQAHNRKIPCYVATHSLLNYAQWQIVSPQFSLLDAGADGFIAQVWTGTARAANTFDGITKERTFATAFLEYGALDNIARSSGKPIWYLNDPIEDNPNHSWTDYRRNWESTLTASLLQPAVSRYEVLPWPNRIFEKNALYPSVEPEANLPTPPKITIPESYATELQAVFFGMKDIGHYDGQARWEHAGTEGIGVLVSDSLMFQRAAPSPSDPHLGHVYGLALPLLLQGMPVEPVSVEGALRAGGSHSLDRYRVLLLSYEGQKPPSAAFHRELAAWVRHGGSLIVVDKDTDPYNAATGWWNTGTLHDVTPRQDLFRALHLSFDSQGLHAVGHGFVLYDAESPSALSKSPHGASVVRALLQQIAAASKIQLKTSPALVMRRGPYVIAAGLEDSTIEPKNVAAITLRGTFIDLFDNNLTVHDQVQIHAGDRRLLLDVNHIAASHPRILAAASRIQKEESTAHSLQFQADGIDGTAASLCILSPSSPTNITVDGSSLPSDQYVQHGRILHIRMTNHALPQTIHIEW